MGDLGYFDETGYLWFCGRQAERVETGGGIYYSDCCEGVFNRHSEVFRTALIAWRNDGVVHPAIVVEPIDGAFPKTGEERERFIEALKTLGAESEATRSIEFFFFEKAFPVDVRHNAKIHRLTLAKRFSN
jgi:acyl-CoA synthetase (AMP-forming)/AMP-acid ligase II